MGLKTVWLKKPEDKDSIESALRSGPVIERLRQILSDRYAELENRESSTETYKDLSWSHVQAHMNGRKEELQFIFKLLDLGE